MREVRGRWLRVGMPVIFACACAPQALDPSVDGGTSGAAGGVAAMVCAPGSDVDRGAGAPPAAPVSPTPTPSLSSCAPLSEAFIFPAPGAAASGTFSRCASFSVGKATAVAVSPDGRLAALATEDGLARVVEVASRQVVAVLAPPRAMIDYVAFAPDGGAVLTMARAQREVTLWRDGGTGMTPVWTTTLDGHRYDHMFGGGLAVAPDGKSAVASPGTGVYLLDVASGKVRQAARSGEAILDVAYGLNGSRVVVAIPSLLAHCVHTPNGGVVALLDGNLQAITTLVDLGSYPGWHGTPAFRLSPTADQVFVAASGDETTAPRAFKLSDGTALPTVGFATLPLALMPDGATMLVAADGALQRVGVADGAVTSTVMLPGEGGPIGMSADGSVVAFAGAGNDLLRVWKPGDAVVSAVCAAKAPAAGSQTSSLSADGQLLALAQGGDVRVVRRADGATVMGYPTNPATRYARVELSPQGRYVAIAPALNATGGATAVRTSDGASVASFTPDTSGWLDFLFTPREDRVYALTMRSPDEFGLDVVSLAGTGSRTTRIVPAYSSLLGFSAGCPVLYTTAKGVWRSCDSCEDTPIAAGKADQDVFGPRDAVLSSDGLFVAVAGSFDAPGVTLWRMPPDPKAVLTIGRRAEDAAWWPQEFPVAIAPGGGRILTGAEFVGSCYDGPQFEVYVRDSKTGTDVLDRLPPGVTSVDAAVSTVAYGPQLWCAR